MEWNVFQPFNIRHLENYLEESKNALPAYKGLIVRTVACLNISRVCTGLQSQGEIKTAVTRAQQCLLTRPLTLALFGVGFLQNKPSSTDTVGQLEPNNNYPDYNRWKPAPNNTNTHGFTFSPHDFRQNLLKKWIEVQRGARNPTP